MKIRIDELSIRFRLAESEWTHLLGSGSIRQTTRLPGAGASHLTCTIHHDAAAHRTTIAHDGATLAVALAPADWLALRQSPREGVRIAIPYKDTPGSALLLIVEKDIDVAQKRAAKKAAALPGGAIEERT